LVSGADVFIMAAQLDIQPSLIPEFPVRLGTIYPTIPSNQSCKIDYLALDASDQRAVFVELKTDSSSRRAKQDGHPPRHFAKLIRGVIFAPPTPAPDHPRTQTRTAARS
jgi:hypothetical protein